MKAIDQTRASTDTHSEPLPDLSSAAVGYAMCFDTALAMTARRMKKDITSSRTSAKLGRLSRGGEGCSLTSRSGKQFA
jgi:hypothetical protein